MKESGIITSTSRILPSLRQCISSLVIFIVLSVIYYPYLTFGTPFTYFDDLPQDKRIDGIFSEVECVGDLNKDGNLEVILSGSQGGNCWICGGKMILRLKKDSGEVEDLTPRPFGRVWTPMDVKDLNGDGSIELIAFDGRLEFVYPLDHVHSPYSYIVYSWSKSEDRYIHTPSIFTEFYQDLINKELEVIKDNYSKESRFAHISAWYSLYLHLLHSGKDQPWGELQKLWDKYAQKDYDFKLQMIRCGLKGRGFLKGSQPEGNSR